MIAGASLGDGIFAMYPLGDRGSRPCSEQQPRLACFTSCVVAWLTRRHLHVPPQNPPAALRLLVHYWPGAVVLVAITLGMGLGVTTVFLTRFATELRSAGIRTFFTAYSIVALIFRVPGTRWANTIGRHKTILLGLLGNALGHFLLPFVRANGISCAARDGLRVRTCPALSGNCFAGSAEAFPPSTAAGDDADPGRLSSWGRPSRRRSWVGSSIATVSRRCSIRPPRSAWPSPSITALTAARQPDNDNDPSRASFSTRNSGPMGSEATRAD